MSQSHLFETDIDHRCDRCLTPDYIQVKFFLHHGHYSTLKHRSKWFVIFENDNLLQIANLLIAVIETFHEGRKEASSGFMAHALIRAASQTLLNVILALKSTLSTTNRRQEIVSDDVLLIVILLSLVSSSHFCKNG